MPGFEWGCIIRFSCVDLGLLLALSGGICRAVGVFGICLSMFRGWPGLLRFVWVAVVWVFAVDLDCVG